MNNISTKITTHWKIAIALSFLTITPFLYLYSDILIALVQWWRNTSKYAHSLIIFPAILYLIFEQRKELKKLPVNPDFFALIPLTIATFLLPLFNFIDVQIIAETLFVLIIPLILWAIMGRTILTKIAIPLALLITVAPIWELFAPVLTNVTAEVAHLSLNILGIPVFKDEMYLTIPEGVFVIEEGCGGFRYFISGLSLGLIFAHLNFRSFNQQITIVVLAVALSIVTNWVRVMIVIWAGHVTDMQHPYVKAHVNLGWYVFAIAFALYFFLCNRLIPNTPTKKVRDERSSSIQQPKVPRNKTIGGLILLALLAPKLIIDQLASANVDSTPEFQFETVQKWNTPALNISDWAPIYKGAEQRQVATYTNGALSVDIFYALYQEQSQGQELINFTNSITNDNWAEFTPKDTQLSIHKGTLNDVKKIRANTSQGERTIWMWYNISGVETSDRRLAKLLELKKIVTQNKLSMVIAVSTSSNKMDTNSIALIEDLLNKVYPQIINHFSPTKT